jgi:hypothetical protein
MIYIGRVGGGGGGRRRRRSGSPAAREGGLDFEELDVILDEEADEEVAE